MNADEALALWKSIARLADTATLAIHSQPGPVTLRAIDKACGDAFEAAAPLAELLVEAGLPKEAGLYARDGKCHNAEPGTYGHECGKPAVWLGTTPGGFFTGFCSACKEHGSEAARIRLWMPHPMAEKAGRTQ